MLIVFNYSKAISINSADIVSLGECEQLLKYKGIVVKTFYSAYWQDGVSYPAYCLDKTKQGVNDQLSYSVSVQNAITDVNLWRIIINGYPYKSIEELGCANRNEAFTATKQAIYCYIHGNSISDYAPIGEAGQRTLNALNKILNDAQNCKETQVSNIVNINKEQEFFEIDEKEKNCVSKTYSINAMSNIKNYKVIIESEFIEDIKITDINNNIKDTFSPKEKFKILIPIKSLTKDGKITIKLETQIESKPVLYGMSGNIQNQDYALTAATYEEAIGEINDNFYENKTKLKIIKQDEKTKQRLSDVVFNILDDNKEIVYANLKTDENGEIEIKHIKPGKYYIQEKVTKDGYLINDNLIEVDLIYNQELNLTINNSFEEEPQISKNQVEISKKVVKKLPITGM